MSNIHEVGDGFIIGYTQVDGYTRICLSELADGGERVLVSVDYCNQKIIIDFLDNNRAKLDSGLGYKEKIASKIDEKKRLILPVWVRKFFDISDPKVTKEFFIELGENEYDTKRLCLVPCERLKASTQN